eukprot:Opistho-2@89814
MHFATSAENLIAFELLLKAAVKAKRARSGRLTVCDILNGSGDLPSSVAPPGTKISIQDKEHAATGGRLCQKCSESAAPTTHDGVVPDETDARTTLTQTLKLAKEKGILTARNRGHVNPIQDHIQMKVKNARLHEVLMPRPVKCILLGSHGKDTATGASDVDFGVAYATDSAVLVRHRHRVLHDLAVLLVSKELICTRSTGWLLQLWSNDLCGVVEVVILPEHVFKSPLKEYAVWHKHVQQAALQRLEFERIARLSRGKPLIRAIKKALALKNIKIRGVQVEHLVADLEKILELQLHGLVCALDAADKRFEFPQDKATRTPSTMAAPSTIREQDTAVTTALPRPFEAMVADAIYDVDLSAPPGCPEFRIPALTEPQQRALREVAIEIVQKVAGEAFEKEADIRRLVDKYTALVDEHTATDASEKSRASAQNSTEMQAVLTEANDQATLSDLSARATAYSKIAAALQHDAVLLKQFLDSTCTSFQAFASRYRPLLRASSSVISMSDWASVRCALFADANRVTLRPSMFTEIVRIEPSAYNELERRLSEMAVIVQALVRGFLVRRRISRHMLGTLKSHGFVGFSRAMNDSREFEVTPDHSPAVFDQARLVRGTRAFDEDECSAYELSVPVYDRRSHGGWLVGMRQMVMRDEVGHLLRLHNERLCGVEPNEPTPVITTQGCLLLLAKQVLGEGGKFGVTMSVQLLSSPRALVIHDGRLSAKNTLYERKLTQGNAGHRIAALARLKLRGEGHPQLFNSTETMRLLSLTVNRRALLYWAEIDGVDGNGQVIGLTTFLERRRVVRNAAHLTLKSMLAGVEQMWILSRSRDEFRNIDTIKVPLPSRIAPDFRPEVSGCTLDHETLCTLPRRMPNALNKIEHFFREMEDTLRARPSDSPVSPDAIYHVTVRAGDTASPEGGVVALTFDPKEMEDESPCVDVEDKSPCVDVEDTSGDVEDRTGDVDDRTGDVKHANVHMEYYVNP